VPGTAAERAVTDRPVTLFLSGDVMIGRGVDQVLACPADPELRERAVRDARTYVRLAEEVNGPIRRPMGPAEPWGELLAVLDAAAPDARIVTSRPA
jgi:poly-gamma-glutamate synthesis protein (capsule biosynthesis protein)